MYSTDLHSCVKKKNLHLSKKNVKACLEFGKSINIGPLMIGIMWYSQMNIKLIHFPRIEEFDVRLIIHRNFHRGLLFQQLSIEVVRSWYRDLFLYLDLVSYIKLKIASINMVINKFWKNTTIYKFNLDALEVTFQQYNASIFMTNNMI